MYNINKMTKTTKQWLLATATLLSAATSQAQSIEDVRKMYEYGRFETTVKQATALAGTNAEANYYLGLGQLALGKIADAKATFSKQAADVANQAGVARVLYAEKKPTEAMAILNGLAAKAKKKDATTFKLLADAITASEGADYKKAIDWYTRSLDIQKSGATFMALGDAYMRFPDGGGNAETNYVNALDNKGDASLVALKRGNLWFEAQEYDSAISNFNRCIKLDPNNPQPYLFFANSAYYKNDFPTAKSNIEKYLQLSDVTQDDVYKYINILYLSKDYAAASTKIKESLGKGLDKPYILRLAGYCDYETGNYAEALTYMDQYFAKAEKGKILVTDYEYYAKICAKIPGKESLVEEYNNKAFDMDPSDKKYTKLKDDAKKIYDAKDYVNAALAYQKYLAKTPAEKITTTDFNNAGFSCFASKDYTNAVRIFKMFAEKDKTEPVAFYYLAQSIDGLSGKTQEGVDAFNSYIALVGEANAEKKSQLTKAYQYIIQYYNDKNDGVNAKLFANKLLTVDNTNTFATEIINYYKNGGVPKTTTPVKETPKDEKGKKKVTDKVGKTLTGTTTVTDAATAPTKAVKTTKTKTKTQKK